MSEKQADYTSDLRVFRKVTKSRKVELESDFAEEKFEFDFASV